MTRKAEQKANANLDGPFFKLRGEPKLTVKDAYEDIAAQWERLGFELVAQRCSQHRVGGSDELFTLWVHPLGVVLSADTYHGRWVDDPRGGEYGQALDADFLHLNSLEVSWQSHFVGEAVFGAMRGFDASGSVAPQGDGSHVGAYSKTYAQTGSWVDLFEMMNRQAALLPLSHWKPARIHLPDGLHWGPQASSREERSAKVKEEIRLSRQALVEGLPTEARRALASNELFDIERGGHRGGSAPYRAFGEFNRQVFFARLAAGSQDQSPQDSLRLIAWARGDFPADPEGFEPAGPSGVGALHALVCAPAEALAALDVLSDHDLARLANAPDARGVTPFLRCFELCRTDGALAQSALRMMEVLARRVGPALVLANKQTSALNLLLADAWPASETVDWELWGVEPARKAFEICAEHGLPIDRGFFQAVDAPETHDRQLGLSQLEPAPAMRWLEGQGVADVFFAQAPQGEGPALASLRATFERLAFDLATPAAAQRPRRAL